MALLFNGNSPKKIIYNGFDLARVIYNGVVVWLAKVLTLITGKPPLTLPNSTGEDLVDYKIYGNSKQRGLPDGYTELDCIQATSGQYIDTGVIGNLNTKVIIDFDFTLENSTTAFTIFGARTGAGNADNVGILWGTYQGRLGLNIDFGDYSNYRVFYETSSENTRFKVELGKDGRYLYDSQGNVLASNTTVNTTAFTSPSNLLLFKQYGAPSGARDYTGNIYSCKIYDSNVLIRDFIPCINSENEVGMYDIVNKVFYPNLGTGSFTAGSKVDLPEGYQRLEYIESTGTQYIDTGITATNNTGMSIKYRYTADGSAAISGIFKSANPRQDTFFISSQTGSLPGTAFIAHRGNTTSTTLGDVSLNTDYTVKINYKNDGKIYYDDDYITDVGTRAVWDATIPIFARLNASNQNIAVSNSRIYYVEFTEGNTISHKFVPAKNSSGTIGMYDVVGGIFHTNAGTGDFIAGNAITLPNGYIKLDYIEADGEQYIDTGIVPDINTQVDYKVRFLQGALASSPLIGARVGSVNYNRFFPISYSNPNNTLRTSLGASQSTADINFDIDYEGSFQPQNSMSIINGTSYDLSGHNFRKDSNYNLYLFATSGYTDNLYLSSGVMYYCKIYQSGTLVRDFVPCITPDNQIGLYDLVSKQFFSNQGTGSFIARTASKMQFVGDNETGLPYGYTQLDYIEGDGTQNINTGFIPNQNTKVELDIQLLSAGGALFGSREAVQSRGFTIQALSAGYFGGTYGSENRNSSMGYDYLRHTHILDKNKYYVDGNLVYTYSTATFTCPGNAYIFNMYNNSAPSTGNKARLYGCKIWDNGTLSRNFVPCKNESDIAGVYDTVNRVFYSSSGTENFISGNEVAKGGYKIPVNVTGRNKYDISKSVLGGLSSADGSETTSTTRVRTDYIEIDNTYSIRIDENDNYSIVNIYYYDENKNYTGYSNLNTGGRLREYTGTVISGTKYIRPVFCVYNATSTDIDLNAFKQSKIQIEQGSTITDYEEYFNRTDNIYLSDPLRKLGSADVVKLPSGYTQLEYIESTGTQYIDTNYAPNAQTKIQAVVAFTEDTGSMQNYGAIANLGTSSRVNYARWHFGVFSNKLCVFRENTTQSGDIKLDYDNDFHTYEITNTSCSLDDTTKDITLYTNSNITFTLFARNGYTNAGGTASIAAYSNSKLKSFKIYENNVLIRDFIPCKDPNNVVGLYDVINNVFYVNQGTGTFTAGSSVYADYLDYENQIVKWIVGLPSPVEEAVTLPDIQTNEGDNIIDVETFIKPSYMSVQYYKKGA